MANKGYGYEEDAELESDRAMHFDATDGTREGRGVDDQCDRCGCRAITSDWQVAVCHSCIEGR